MHDEKQIRLVRRLKQLFEVLFVSKRPAVVDRSRPARRGLRPLDARNNPSPADCQLAAR